MSIGRRSICGFFIRSNSRRCFDGIVAFDDNGLGKASDATGFLVCGERLGTENLRERISRGTNAFLENASLCRAETHPRPATCRGAWRRFWGALESPYQFPARYYPSPARG